MIGVLVLGEFTAICCHLSLSFSIARKCRCLWEWPGSQCCASEVATLGELHNFNSLFEIYSSFQRAQHVITMQSLFWWLRWAPGRGRGGQMGLGGNSFRSRNIFFTTAVNPLQVVLEEPLAQHLAPSDLQWRWSFCQLFIFWVIFPQIYRFEYIPH